MQPTPIEHCMGGEGTVLMEKLLDAPAEMLGKGRAYVRHTIRPGVSIGSHTHEHEMETMVVVSGRARHVINGEEQLLEAGVSADLIRLSVGIEYAEDIIADIRSHLEPTGGAFVEIPDRHGTGRKPNFITSYVNEAIGLKL